MRLLLKLAACVPLSLVLLGGVAAETPSGNAPAAATEEERAINIVAEKLCRAEPIVGTRIPIRHKCDTPAQLKQYQRQAREIVEEYRRRPCAVGTGTGESDAAMSC